MSLKNLGLSLKIQKWVEMGQIPLVRLELELRGFKAWILFLVSTLGTPWDLLDQNLSAIVDLEDMVKVTDGGDVEKLWSDKDGL
ncbi:hypothetical protein Tco_1027983 [Tanacetum coccineum]